MTIHELIGHYTQTQSEVDRITSLPNCLYDPAQHFAAIDRQNSWLIKMINHKDWTIDLHDQYCPSNINDIPYPVSC